MRTILLLLTTILGLSGCADKEISIKNDVPPALFGKWKAIEEFSTDGGSPATWKPIRTSQENEYVFFENNEITTEHLKVNCTKGSYSYEDKNGEHFIYFVFPCISYEKLIERLDERTLILDYQNFEPRKVKYIKITE